MEVNEELEIIDIYYNLKGRYHIRIPQILSRTLSDLVSLLERIDRLQQNQACSPALDQCRKGIDQMLLESGIDPENNDKQYTLMITN